MYWALMKQLSETLQAVLDLVHSCSLQVLNLYISIGKEGGGEFVLKCPSEADENSLSIAAPPIASITPTSYSYVEGDTRYIMCDASGTDPVITWSKANVQSLPSGVFQLGNYLAVNQPSSFHEGEYSCTAVNVAGGRSSILQITSKVPS